MSSVVSTKKARMSRGAADGNLLEVPGVGAVEAMSPVELVATTGDCGTVGDRARSVKLGAGVDPRMEVGLELSVACPIVPAMQDMARLLMLEREGFEMDVPNLCFSWLWFRRYILSVPRRCTDVMARCHRLEEAGGRAGWITEREYPASLLGKDMMDEDRLQFEEQLDWYRQLVLGSRVVAVKRAESGEIGMKVLGRQKYRAVREALVGFVTPISAEVAGRLEELGYTSLLRDSGRSYILYGPLALVQHGESGVSLGPVQRGGGFDWVYSVGPKLMETTLVVNAKWVRLKGEGKGAQRGTGKLEYTNGEEVILDYRGGQGAESEVLELRRGDGAGRSSPADGVPDPEELRTTASRDREERRTARELRLPGKDSA